MNIAVVTGASSGLGRQFAHLIDEKSNIDEIWLIARRENRLNELAAELKTPCKVLPLDLTDETALKEYANELKSANANVTLLINCSGFGKIGRYDEIDMTDTLNMIELNCKALVYITQTTLDYMQNGAKIIEIASCAAFQPLPYMNVYAATKSFVLSYSRSLNAELKDRNICVTAVCPGWIKTEFIDVAKQQNNKRVNKFYNLSSAEDVAKKAMKDSEKCKKISVFSFFTKCQHLLTKISPSTVTMFFWSKLR